MHHVTHHIFPEDTALQLTATYLWHRCRNWICSALCTDMEKEASDHGLVTSF